MPDPFNLPPVPTELSQAAARLREKLAPEPKRTGPPEENGARLATIKRGDDEELRLSWAQYNGRNFLNIRVWKKGEDGAWWPEKSKGMTVRVRELADFADGVGMAVARAMSEDSRGA